MCFFFQAEAGIRGPLWSRGLEDVYKGQVLRSIRGGVAASATFRVITLHLTACPWLSYTSDAADDTPCLELSRGPNLHQKMLTQT